MSSVDTQTEQGHFSRLCEQQCWLEAALDATSNNAPPPNSYHPCLPSFVAIFIRPVHLLSDGPLLLAEDKLERWPASALSLFAWVERASDERYRGKRHNSWKEWANVFRIWLCSYFLLHHFPAMCENTSYRGCTTLWLAFHVLSLSPFLIFHECIT